MTTIIHTQLRLRILLGQLVYSLLICSPLALSAEERLDMQGTSIVGNRELPKMLYIVPWKTAERVDIATPTITSILDQPLTMIKRRDFRRQVKYHQWVFPTVTPKK